MQFLLKPIDGMGASYYNPPDNDEQKQITAELLEFDKNYKIAMEEAQKMLQQQRLTPKEEPSASKDDSGSGSKA